MKKEINFTNLNTISTFSFLNSLIRIEEIIKFAKDNKQKYASLIDENVMYGSIDFYLECKKNDLIPVIGLHLKDEKYDCLLIALNYEGYKNLIKISSFYQLKRNYDLLELLKDVAIVDFLSNIKTDSKFYYSINENEKNYIALQTARYIKKSDYSYYVLLSAIQNNITIDDNEELKEAILNNKEGNEYLLTLKEAKQKFNDIGLMNLDNLLTNINLEIDFHQNNLIKFPIPNEFKDSNEYLKKLAIEGLKKKFNSDMFSQNYIDRLKYELNIINKLGFSDYFLVVQEYVNFAKNNDILVGPGRGSAVGSLVAYALDITMIDPIKYDLLFERFLNPARTSMPDIDIDIADIKRQEVIDHLFNFYDTNGLERVSYLITFQTIKLRTAIRDVGRVLKIDLSIIDRISKSISFKYDESNPKKELIKSIKKEWLEKYEELFRFALKIVGLYRQYSMHAAGVVLSNSNLFEIIPIQYGNNNLVLSQYSMEYLEILGLLKMDLLGLSNLTLLQNIFNFIKSQTKDVIDLNKINLNDIDVYNSLSDGDTFGIFQFESPGMTNLLKRVKPKSIDDLAMVSAMFRPGPQNQINDWIKRRNDPNEIKYLIPELEPILKSTAGILVYQEQVMQIAQKIANFSLSDADLLRRAISKKYAKELIALKNKFINQSIENNINENSAIKIYDYIFEFASYGFNKSHAIAYAYISYWIAYLKYYYPMQFIQSFLLFKSFKDNQEEIMKFANKMNIKLFAPNILNSEYNFTLNARKKELYFGFETIKGIGASSFEKINELKAIANKNITNIKLCLLLSFNVASKKLLETLIFAGCYDNFNVDRNYMLKLISVIDDFSKVLKNYDNIDDLINLVDAKLDLIDYKPLSQNDLLANEISLLGFSKQSLQLSNNKSTNDFPLDEEIEITLLNFSEKQSKKGDLYLVCSIKYNELVINATISPWKYKKFINDNDFFKEQENYLIILKKNNMFYNIEKIIKKE